jgi:RNA polymerase sigma-70 factor (ECF subfamily)
LGDLDEPVDERSLVERARIDPEAFAQLYRRYVSRVYAFAFRRTGRQDVAEDITSATFERALRHLESFTWRASGFGPWLFRITANELADHFRRASRDASDRAFRAAATFQSSNARDPAEALDDRERAAELLAAMNALSPRYQQALSLRYLAGLSSAEAAAAMGMPRATMAVVLHRATRALRRAMTSGTQAAGRNLGRDAGGRGVVSEAIGDDPGASR